MTARSWWPSTQQVSNIPPELGTNWEPIALPKSSPYSLIMLRTWFSMSGRMPTRRERATSIERPLWLSWLFTLTHDAIRHGSTRRALVRHSDRFCSYVPTALHAHVARRYKQLAGQHDEARAKASSPWRRSRSRCAQRMKACLRSRDVRALGSDLAFPSKMTGPVSFTTHTVRRIASWAPSESVGCESSTITGIPRHSRRPQLRHGVQNWPPPVATIVRSAGSGGSSRSYFEEV
jgi:hypothetical protein